MEAIDFRRAAEEVVEKFHINDLEWREILIEQYTEAFERQMRIARRTLVLLKSETDERPMN